MRKALLSCFGLAMLASTPGLATRLPPALDSVANHYFSDARVRLDGSIETRKGEIYLPVVPSAATASKSTLGKVVVDTFPINSPIPDVVAFSDGWFYLRVVRKGVINTVALPDNLPGAAKKMLLAGKFPDDLIVPDNMRLPKSLKPIVGSVDVQLVDDAMLAKPDFGLQLAKTKTAATTMTSTATSTDTDAAKSAANPPTRAPAGEVFVTSPSTGNITLLDEVNLAKIIDFPTEGTPMGMAYCKGKLYIADQSKARVLVLDLKKKQFLGQIDMQPKSAPKGLAIEPTGKYLYVSESALNDVAVVDVASNLVISRTRVPPGPARMTIAPNGYSIVVLNVISGQATIFSTVNQRVLGAVSVGTMPNSVVISKDSTRAYVSNRMSNTISVIDIPKHVVMYSIPTAAGPTGLALSVDDSKIYVADAKDNLITVYDVKSKAKLQEVKLPLDVDFPSAMSMMPDGKRIIVSSASTDAVGVLNVADLAFDHQPVIGHTSDEILWVPAQ